jgi:polyisoprenoid-binding protein YceI
MTRKMVAAAVLASALALLAGCGGKAPQQAQPVQASQPAPQQVQPVQASQPAQVGGPYQIVAAESHAQYSVHEKFLDKNLPNVAVGKTTALQGALVLADGKLQPSTVTVDVSTLKSDSDKRDGRVKKQALETDKFPTAEFTITGVDGVQAFPEGQEVSLKLAGKLKIHGVEKPWTWDAKGLMQGGTFKLTATTSFKMSEFGITPPNIINLIAVDDSAQLDVAIVAKKG